MELRHLRYFAAVADELNFTRAAQKLHVAQPALSRQVRALEEELGVKLLARTNRGIHLTEAGRAFLAETRVLLQQSEEAIRVARGAGEPARGQLKLGYIWGLFHSTVPPVLEEFHRHAPETAIHLFDLAPLEQARAILESRLDAGFIGFEHEANCRGLSKRKVGVCEFVAALPKGHRAARKSVVPLTELADDFFLGISAETYPGASRYVADACASAGFRPKFLQMVERGYTILGLVAGRCGVALLPESLKALPHPGIVFRRLTDPPRAELFLAWKTGEQKPLLKRFLNMLGGPRV